MNKRRDFIKQIVAGTAALSLPTTLLSFAKENGLPIRAITKGPKYRWFGYYDKLQFDPSNRYILGMEVDFEYRSPTSEDVIKLGYIDLKDHDKWVEIGETRAWGWQQGCMLQWVSGTSSKVIWNDRREDEFVSIIKDIETGEEKIIPKAIYTISPDGKYAVGTDFPRIQFYRPGYGYVGVKDPFIDQNAPATAGIFKINLKTGKSKLIINYQDIAKIPFNGKDI
ncbi:MAG: hypothetical protein KAH25_06370, partial [Bacteroidales bacterium]|nr:hypothetical protein [Bacteroidales bacterium]